MKKRVLLVVHQLNHGGVQKSLLTALNSLDYEQVDVTLYIRKNRTELIDDVNKNVKKIVINNDKTHYYRRPYMVILQALLWICKLANLDNSVGKIQSRINSYLNKEKMKYEKVHYFQNDKEYDVAVSYIQGYTAQFVAEYVKAKKKIMFYHGSIDEVHEVHERIMPLYDKIVGVNKNIEDILKKIYPTVEGKITHIDNYVDYEEIRKKSKAYSVDRKYKQYVFCTCGRLTPVKGFDLALKAAKKLKEAGMFFVWYFVGDGPERNKLEKLIVEYDLVDFVKITGMQENPYPYINGCDIYVQPSLEESYGLTIAEAKILCRPIISTDTIGGCLQLENRETGILTKIDSKDIVEGVFELVNDRYLKNTLIRNLEKLEYKDYKNEYSQQWAQLLEG